MVLIYNLFIQWYLLAIKIAAFFGNIKAKNWIQGRKNTESKLSNFNPENKKVIWFHCASLGEFEQGRPLIEKTRKTYHNHQILLTFFSPSGYEIRKNYEYVDLVTYLPLDTKSAVVSFVQKIKPELFIVVKYEYWYHLIQTLQKSNIPIILISAIFDKKQIFFKSYGGFFRKMLFQYHQIFIQNLHSFELLKTIGLTNMDIAGDTRVDRVSSIAEEEFNDSKINTFVTQSPIIICGSTWQQDESLISEIINRNLFDAKWIIIPHEIQAENINFLKKKIKLKSSIYSESEDHKESDVLIIDKIGLLAYIYRYANIVYIGGGFGKGIHNTLEAIAYGKPVIFGPHYQKFNEAVFMINAKSGISISDSETLMKAIQYFLIPNKYQKAQISNLEYIEINKGATDKILFYIEKIIKST